MPVFVAMAEWKHAHLNDIGAAENETVLYKEFKDKLGILTANLTNGTAQMPGFSRWKSISS